MVAPADSITRTNPIASMLQSHIENGGTVESAGALAKLYMEMEEFTAKKEFARAFGELQEELPAVIANHNHAQLGFSYASLEDMQDVIIPVARKHGIFIRFTEETLENGMIKVDCIATHKYSGHSERSGMTVRTGGAAKISNSGKEYVSVTQLDVGALKTAKRCALANMFNLKIDYDADARLLGDFITPEQAESLEARVKATGRDVQRFLKLAAAETFAEIRQGKYAMLDGLLSKAERARNPGGEMSEAEKAAITAREAEEARKR